MCLLPVLTRRCKARQRDWPYCHNRESPVPLPYSPSEEPTPLIPVLLRCSSWMACLSLVETLTLSIRRTSNPFPYWRCFFHLYLWRTCSNGVIVITTKRGALSNQHAKVTFRTQLGISQLAQENWNLMNTEERIAYEKEVGLDTGKDYDKLRQININWFDEVFNKSALLQNYEVQVNGATDKIRYYVSGNFYDQDALPLSPTSSVTTPAPMWKHKPRNGSS